MLPTDSVALCLRFREPDIVAENSPGRAELKHGGRT